jgi:nucleoside recognition membrane protein YjiH
MNMMNRIFWKNRRRKLILAALLVLLVSLVVVAGVVAQTGGGFDLTWHVVGSSGGKMAGSGFVLNGTAGQVAVSSSTGSGDTLLHGFWQKILWQIQVYLPVTLKN